MAVNILNLSAYSVIDIKQNDNDYHIWAETVNIHPKTCIYCHSVNLVGYGRFEQLVKDLPSHGKRVGIYINTRRLKCRTCGKTFSETLPEVDNKRGMTKRLIAYIGKQSLSRTFASIADDVGVTEGTVRNIFRDYVNELEATVRFETPKWMGIDEVHIIKRPRCVISNIQHNTIVNILHDRTKKTVAKYLFNLKGKEDVRYVAMDMWNPYKDAVKDVLPEATIVIDKFHIVRMANEAMERVRKQLRASLQPNQRRTLMYDRFILLKRQKDLSLKEGLLLSTWLANHKVLNDAYHLKEWFYDIWDKSRDKDDAIRRYQAWTRDASQYEAFQPILIAMNKWHNEIFSYFDHKITNAYTESLNNLIKVMNRLGRGYSFEALRAKILFTGSVHKLKRPSFVRVAEPGIMHFVTHTYAKPKNGGVNYGTDISTLTRLIDTGNF